MCGFYMVYLFCDGCGCWVDCVSLWFVIVYFGFSVRC